MADKNMSVPVGSFRPGFQMPDVGALVGGLGPALSMRKAGGVQQEYLIIVVC